MVVPAVSRLAGPYAVRRAALTFLLSLVLTACAAQTRPAPPTIETIADLRSALEAAGVLVSQAPDAFAPDLGLEGRGLLVGGEPVVAYEYDSVVERRLVSDTIRAGGYRVKGKPVDWPARPNIWVTGRLLLVYSGVNGGTVLLLSGLLGDPLTFEAPAVDEPYPPAILAAIGAAAEAAGASPEEVRVTEYEFQEWPDGCLGLPGPDEVCAQAVVPGWLVRLNVGGELIVFRLDSVGAELRQE